ncbi:MAG: type II toxin-antitoxin system VapC family toxin [Pseudonocardiaceae bacterium]
MPSAERVLVDTHALLWWQAQPDQARSDRIFIPAWERITAASCVLVSPISCWEVAMLVGKQRVALDRRAATWIRKVLTTDGISVAELTPGIAVMAAELADFHGDRAGRFLYATSRLLDVPLLSKGPPAARLRRGRSHRHRRLVMTGLRKIRATTRAWCAG